MKLSEQPAKEHRQHPKHRRANSYNERTKRTFIANWIKITLYSLLSSLRLLNAKNTTTLLNSTLSRPGDFSFLARALKEFFWLLCWICCTHPRNSTRRRWWWRFFFFGVSRAISHFQCPQFKIDRSWCSFCVVLGLRLSEFNSEVEDVSILAFLRSVLFIRASSLGVWCGIADSVYCGSTIINKTENICEEFPLTYSKNKHRLSQSRKSSQITEFSSSCDFAAGWLEFAHFILNILRVHERNFRSRFQRISRFFSLLAFPSPRRTVCVILSFLQLIPKVRTDTSGIGMICFFCCVVLLRSQCSNSDSFLFCVHFDIISRTDDGWLSIDDLNILWLAVLAQPSSQLLSSAAPCAQAATTSRH